MLAADREDRRPNTWSPVLRRPEQTRDGALDLEDDRLRRRVGRQDVLDTELAQSLLTSGQRTRRTGLDESHHGDARATQSSDGVAIQPAQVVREQHGPGRAGGRGRQQVRDVDTTTYDESLVMTGMEASVTSLDSQPAPVPAVNSGSSISRRPKAPRG